MEYKKRFNKTSNNNYIKNWSIVTCSTRAQRKITN